MERWACSGRGRGDVLLPDHPESFGRVGRAEPGEVLLGPATFERIRDVATVNSLGLVELKGKRDPVELYVLEALSGPYS